MATGTVKWFSDQKGYGFITPEDGSDDLFVHHSNIDAEGFRTLTEGQQVEYEPGQGRKGPEATKGRPAERVLAPSIRGPRARPGPVSFPVGHRAATGSCES